MTSALVVLFLLTYAAIALEEPLRINKSGTALTGAGLLWTIYALAVGDPGSVDGKLAESLTETAQIVFFLIGAMTIVEVVDSHDGFEAITSRIKARSMGAFAWIIGIVTFLLSALLDNLTTTIVMISLGRKLLAERDDRLLMAGLVVIAANAGGAWSPIGDVTTAMLWIGGQITTVPIMTGLLVPSLINLVVPLAVISYRLRGRMLSGPAATDVNKHLGTTAFERNLMFCLGIAALACVPVFKAVTHLPPFMGVLFGLGILWVVGEIVHRDKPYEERDHLTIARALTRIDMSAIVFFIGILLAVATLAHAGILAGLAKWLGLTMGRLDEIVIIIGLVSAIVDNVPIVAATMGMYDTIAHPPDSFLWTFLAYCAGTGGSILIIGSAAGVAAMGIEKVGFLWYMKKFSLLALLGYLAGAMAYIAQFHLTD